MNDVLQKIMNESFTDEQGERFDHERFAELIVQECIDYCGFSKIVGRALKIHFGVEV
jgi:hypothetical protein